MTIDFTKVTGYKTKFVFIGEAGSGKSEIALNFAVALAQRGDKPVHFFDMDMTKPLFRSRDVMAEMEGLGIHFHREDQFYDAPTIVGGVSLMLSDNTSYVVIDLGGNDIGARAIGGFAAKIKQLQTKVYYVLNAYRPWSDSLEHIDGTLSAILKSAHIGWEQLHLVNNPNTGIATTAEEVLAGSVKMTQMLEPYKSIDFTCVSSALYNEVKTKTELLIMPIRLFLTYPWGES